MNTFPIWQLNRLKRMPLRLLSGFTLIEAMLAVALIGFISATILVSCAVTIMLLFQFRVLHWKKWNSLAALPHVLDIQRQRLFQLRLRRAAAGRRPRRGGAEPGGPGAQAAVGVVARARRTRRRPIPTATEPGTPATDHPRVAPGRFHGSFPGGHQAESRRERHHRRTDTELKPRKC